MVGNAEFSYVSRKKVHNSGGTSPADFSTRSPPPRFRRPWRLRSHHPFPVFRVRCHSNVPSPADMSNLCIRPESLGGAPPAAQVLAVVRGRSGLPLAESFRVGSYLLTLQWRSTGHYCLHLPPAERRGRRCSTVHCCSPPSLTAERRGRPRRCRTVHYCPLFLQLSDGAAVQDGTLLPAPHTS